MQETPHIIGFTAGELSPWLSCRFDLQAYQRGASLLENFMVQPYGGLKRRHGSKWVGEASAGALKLFAFRFDENDVLLLEFSKGKIRFFKNYKPVMLNGSAYTLATPWNTDSVVGSLHFVQLNDVIYVTTPHDMPRVLKRYADSDWRLEEFMINPYPRETYTPQGCPVYVSVYPNGKAIIECGNEIFTPDMAGAEYLVVDAPCPPQTLFLNEPFAISATAMPALKTVTTPTVIGKIYYETNSATGMHEYYTCYRKYTKDSYNGFTSAAGYGAFFYPGAMILNNGSPYEVCGDWELRTNGTWNAIWEIWRSYDSYLVNGDFYHWEWTCIKSFEQTEYAARENKAITGSEDKPCRFLLVCRASANHNISAMLYLKIHGGTREYKFKITRVDSAKKATCDCYSYYCVSSENFSSYRWSFGAFGAKNGYPSFSAFHQGRLWFGGMAALPTTLIASVADDYPNFRVSSADDSALHLTLATTDQSRICWVCPSRSLLIGTTAGEWTLSAPDGGGITPGNATFVHQASIGSENKQASGVENTVFYVQRGGKRLREISYKLEADGFTSTDTCLLAEHLFAPGIKEWVTQHGSNPLLWVLMNDGSLAVLTINLEQKITAWQRASFAGRVVEHIIALPSTQDNEDELWLVLRNTANNARTLEYINKTSPYADGLHCGGIEPLPHLAGTDGYAYPDGHPEQACTIHIDADGRFSPPPGSDTSGTWCIGAAIRSELCTMPMEQETSFNTIRQEGRVRLRLLDSDAHFRYGAGHADRWETYRAEQDHLPTTYSGSIRLSHIPAPGVGQGFRLQVDSINPLNLIALSIEFDYHGH